MDGWGGYSPLYTVTDVVVVLVTVISSGWQGYIINRLLVEARHLHGWKAGS